MVLHSLVALPQGKQSSQRSTGGLGLSRHAYFDGKTLETPVKDRDVPPFRDGGLPESVIVSSAVPLAWTYAQPIKPAPAPVPIPVLAPHTDKVPSSNMRDQLRDAVTSHSTESWSAAASRYPAADHVAETPKQAFREIKRKMTEAKPVPGDVVQKCEEVRSTTADVKPDIATVKPANIEVKLTAPKVKPKITEVKPVSPIIKPTNVEVKQLSQGLKQDSKRPKGKITQFFKPQVKRKAPAPGQVITERSQLDDPVDQALTQTSYSGHRLDQNDDGERTTDRLIPVSSLLETPSSVPSRAFAKPTSADQYVNETAKEVRSIDKHSEQTTRQPEVTRKSLFKVQIQPPYSEEPDTRARQEDASVNQAQAQAHSKQVQGLDQTNENIAAIAGLPSSALVTSGITLRPKPVTIKADETVGYRSQTSAPASQTLTKSALAQFNHTRSAEHARNANLSDQWPTAKPALSTNKGEETVIQAQEPASLSASDTWSTDAQLPWDAELQPVQTASYGVATEVGSPADGAKEEAASRTRDMIATHQTFTQLDHANVRSSKRSADKRVPSTIGQVTANKPIDEVNVQERDNPQHQSCTKSPAAFNSVSRASKIADSETPDEPVNTANVSSNHKSLPLPHTRDSTAFQPAPETVKISLPASQIQSKQARPPETAQIGDIIDPPEAWSPPAAVNTKVKRASKLKADSKAFTPEAVMHQAGHRVSQEHMKGVLHFIRMLIKTSRESEALHLCDAWLDCATLPQQIAMMLNILAIRATPHDKTFEEIKLYANNVRDLAVMKPEGSMPDANKRTTEWLLEQRDDLLYTIGKRCRCPPCEANPDMRKDRKNRLIECFEAAPQHHDDKKPREGLARSKKMNENVLEKALSAPEDAEKRERQYVAELPKAMEQWARFPVTQAQYDAKMDELEQDNGLTRARAHQLQGTFIELMVQKRKAAKSMVMQFGGPARECTHKAKLEEAVKHALEISDMISLGHPLPPLRPAKSGPQQVEEPMRKRLARVLIAKAAMSATEEEEL